MQEFSKERKSSEQKHSGKHLLLLHPEMKRKENCLNKKEIDSKMNYIHVQIDAK
jgi:hypothetical protein